MYEILSQPWPWYVSGLLIGLFVPLLLIFGNKQLGISSTLQDICSSCFPGSKKLDYFNYEVKANSWRLFFVLGIAIGGFLAMEFLSEHHNVDIAQQTVSDLQELGITNFDSFLPVEVFNFNVLFSLKGVLILIVGGFLVGFGARYANGCTSGHAIMGLSLLNLASLVAVIGFFAGGLVVVHYLLPFILSL